MASELMRQFLAGMSSSASVKKKSSPIAEQRQIMDDYMVGQPVPDDVVTQDFMLSNRPARRFLPAGVTADRCVLYLHGGGYSVGSLDSHHALMATLAVASQAAVIGLDYRLAPEYTYPAALDDAVAAYVELMKSTPAENIMIVGDSAGGGLALATALRLKEEGVMLPACVSLLSPSTDLTCSSASLGDERENHRAMGLLYAGDYPLDTVGISPLFGDMSGLPPLLIQVAKDEFMVDDSTRLAERAKAAGTAVELQVFDEAFHVFQMFTSIPEANSAITDIGAFFARHSG